MPRLAGKRRNDITSDAIQARFQELFGDRDPLVEPGTATGTPGDWWTTFALDPELFHIHALRLNWQKSPDRELPPMLRELALTRTGWLKRSQFVFSQHCKQLRSTGASEQKIAAVKVGPSSPQLDQLESTVLAYVDDLVLSGGRTTDELFDALRFGLSELAILELTFITCFYAMSATMSVALRLEYDDRPDPIVEIPTPDA